MNKPVYLELSKTLMYKFWCDYVKLKYREKAKKKIIWIQVVLLFI